jgi:xylulokinase
LFLGVDIGTSAVKAILIDEQDRPLAQESAPLELQRPQPLWCEQDPEAWWSAAVDVIDRLSRANQHLMTGIRALGLSGQMLGVTVLDEADRPLRPAMLWNDGRAVAEGAELERNVARFAECTGARAMPGFSAPKILWLRRHEPALLRRARRILLTKDFVRLRLTGEAVSDLADASATLLMDTRAGVWSPAIAEACGITVDMLPRLVASGESSGDLRPGLAARWGMPSGVIVAGGGGDNMCGAVGADVVRRGDAFISLGTSGVYFVANDAFEPALRGGMHTHRHAVPGLFAQHGVVLSAAAALSWLCALLGIADIGAFLERIETADLAPDAVPVFTPYLAGERTPHDDAQATAAFSGLSMACGPLHLGRAVLDGVALAIADCQDALRGEGAPIERVALIGGGARSRFWAEIIATVTDTPLAIPPNAAQGPAFGAARLARQAAGGPLIAGPGAFSDRVLPRPAWGDDYRRKREVFHRHYAAFGADRS